MLHGCNKFRQASGPIACVAHICITGTQVASVCCSLQKCLESIWLCSAGIVLLSQNTGLVNLDLSCLPELNDRGVAALSSAVNLRHLKLDRCPLIRYNARPDQSCSHLQNTFSAAISALTNLC